MLTGAGDVLNVHGASAGEAPMHVSGQIPGNVRLFGEGERKVLPVSACQV